MAAVSGSGGPAAPEEPHESPGRRHVEALLDISEEELVRELQPREHPCDDGWAEAVRGWTRAAPLSCLFATQRDAKKPKQTPPSPPSVTDNTPDQSDQQAGPRCHAGGGGPVQAEASRWAPRSPRLLQGDSPEDQREAPVDTRPTRAPRPSHASAAAVPIRHFTFLPPIVSPCLRPQALGGGAGAPEGRSAGEMGLAPDKKSRLRGTRTGALRPDPPTGACPNNPRLFSAQSRSPTAGAPKCPNARCRGLPSGEKVLRVGAAATRASPSKTVCAVNL